MVAVNHALGTPVVDARSAFTALGDDWVHR